MQNLQIRHCLETVVHELATCADLMVPAIQTLAASKPSLGRLKELSENGGNFTMNGGRREVDYGNWQYTTLLKAVQMLSTDISAAVLSISSHSGATTLRMNHDDTEALDLLKISIMKRPRSFEAVDGDTATALFHVLKPHGASGADIYGNVCMKTGIDLKQLQAQEETLFDLVHLQTPRYCQWARDGHRNRWEAQEDDLHSRSGLLLWL